jgi:hypothetical protein
VITEQPTVVAAEREWLKQADHTACRDFDKAVMTLAAGALGLSIAFIHDIAPDPTFVGVLAAAWAFFAASLLAILVSFMTSREVRGHRGSSGRITDDER